jgi:hypothetical protein
LAAIASESANKPWTNVIHDPTIVLFFRVKIETEVVVVVRTVVRVRSPKRVTNPPGKPFGQVLIQLHNGDKLVADFRRRRKTADERPRVFAVQQTFHKLVMLIGHSLLPVNTRSDNQ